MITRDGDEIAAVEAGDPRETMLAAGLWPAFRTRPFGIVPDPEARPDAIFVNATPAMPARPTRGQ